MCTANLHASQQPCQHRWYTLLYPCSPAANLSNCKSRIKLKGWEIKATECPWCDRTTLSPPSQTTHLLFGATPNSGSRRSSGGSSAESLIRGRADSPSPVTSRASSADSITDDEGATVQTRCAERNRSFNARLDAYIQNPILDAIPSRAAPVSGTTTSGAARSGGILGRWGSRKRS